MTLTSEEPRRRPLTISSQAPADQFVTFSNHMIDSVATINPHLIVAIDETAGPQQPYDPSHGVYLRRLPALLCVYVCVCVEKGLEFGLRYHSDPFQYRVRRRFASRDQRQLQSFVRFHQS